MTGLPSAKYESGGKITLHNDALRWVVRPDECSEQYPAGTTVYRKVALIYYLTQVMGGAGKFSCKRPNVLDLIFGTVDWPTNLDGSGDHTDLLLFRGSTNHQVAEEDAEPWDEIWFPRHRKRSDLTPHAPVGHCPKGLGSGCSR
eukprot:s3572_g4.t1